MSARENGSGDRGTEIRSVSALVHGRVLVEGAGDPTRRGRLLVGFHGYGETLEEHARELRSIPGAETWTIAALQGLHRFYRTKTGEVVASWMTKQDRDRAILDNLAWVGSVVGGLVQEIEARAVVVAGFSQGVAMAYRAAHRCGVAVDRLMVLAGDVPPDVAKNRPQRLPPVLMGRGTSDEWYSEAKMARDVEILEGAEVPLETCVFDDGHLWTDAYREAAGRVLAEAAAEVG